MQLTRLRCDRQLTDELLFFLFAVRVVVVLPCLQQFGLAPSFYDMKLGWQTR